MSPASLIAGGPLIDITGIHVHDGAIASRGPIAIEPSTICRLWLTFRDWRFFLRETSPRPYSAISRQADAAPLEVVGAGCLR